MMTKHNAPFKAELQSKIDILKSRRKPIQLGSIHFDSPLILAPMSSIGTAPFRLLMEDLGAGGTVSELISCHGINYKNIRTLEMLKVVDLLVANLNVVIKNKCYHFIYEQKE